ncbi:MAG: hypothetical protein QHJ73_13150, partial [Armatimonadota bacterium]|nr:hypothetical protein [Armatimonadota bacterium]
MLSVLLAAALNGPVVDNWSLAQRNAGVLRISTLFDARRVGEYLSDDAGIERAIDFCRRHGITHVYLESYRDKVVADKEVLARARDRFRAAGFLVSGCVTPTQLGRKSTGWQGIACFTAEESQRDLKAVFEYAASLFDEIMIDDFLFTDCWCPDCVAAKGNRSWAEYRCDLMLRVCQTHALDAARAVNPKARLIIKYPCWHEDFQERGYDVIRQSRAFGGTWVGTETRGGMPGSRWPEEPQYRAYWLMRWLLGIGGEKCGGGWHDTFGTDVVHYLQQSRQTILGGARE